MCLYTWSPAALRSIPVSNSYTDHWLVFLWANQQMAHWVFPFTAAWVKESRAQSKWLRRRVKCWKVWGREGERDQTTYYSDVSLLTVRQTGEPCHTKRTNRRQRNGATYDISAGMGWELPAWGSFPMSRQTERAYSDTPAQKHYPHAFCFIIRGWLILHQSKHFPFFHSHLCVHTEHSCT